MDQVACPETRYGSLELYIFANEADQVSWLSGLSLLCGNPAGDKYIRGGNWAILPTSLMGNNNTDALATTIGVSATPLCSATSATGTVPLGPIRLSCKALLRVRVTYAVRSANDYGIDRYWPRITIVNPTRFPVIVRYGGGAVSARDSLTGFVGRASWWDERLGRDLRVKGRSTRVVEISKNHEIDSLSDFSGRGPVKFTVTAKVRVRTDDARGGPCTLVVRRT